VVPLGINPEPYAAVDPGRADAVRNGNCGPLLLFVGRLRYYKGLDVLIEAMPDIDARLLVVGSGPMERPWRRLAARSPAAARIHFAGEVPEADLPTYYAAADLVVLPSCERSEAFGLVLLEAMAAGRAVIGTELGTGTSFVNQHDETGLVVAPGDAPALAAAVNALMGDPERRRRFGANGRRRVTEHFHVERMVDRTVEVYREVLNGHDAPERAGQPR
jgi:rhamnosyl/mannosyltransferase